MNAQVIDISNQKGGVGYEKLHILLSIIHHDLSVFYQITFILSIDVCPNNSSIWVRQDIGDYFTRSAKYLEDILGTWWTAIPSFWMW